MTGGIRKRNTTGKSHQSEKNERKNDEHPKNGELLKEQFKLEKEEIDDKINEDVDDNNEVKEDRTPFPPGLTSSKNHKARNKGKKSKQSAGLLISIHLEIYHNLKNIYDTIHSLSIKDFEKLPHHIKNTLFDRKNHTYNRLTAAGMKWFMLIFALAFMTRIYKISQPSHIW